MDQSISARGPKDIEWKCIFCNGPAPNGICAKCEPELSMPVKRPSEWWMFAFGAMFGAGVMIGVLSYVQ